MFKVNYDDLKVPNHVAIIVDGNGRWAKARGRSRSYGHDMGFKQLKKIIKYAFSRQIKVLSLYVFSTENFKRSEEEVNHLMKIFVKFFGEYLKELDKENVKVVFSGRDEPLPKEVIEARDKAVRLTEENTGSILNICLNYGGRAEIVDACNKIIEAGVDRVREEEFSKYLYQELPDVDLLIRTSGELRISNFLLWQLSYAEFYFPKVAFPDFEESDFDQAILEYTKRDRRFGKINYDE